MCKYALKNAQTFWSLAFGNATLSQVNFYGGMWLKVHNKFTCMKETFIYWDKLIVIFNIAAR